MIEADIDVREFMQGAAKWDAEFQRRLQSETDALARAGANAARARVPVKTGFLAHSIGVTNPQGPRAEGEFWSQFRAGADYSSYVDRGRGPVTAKKAKFLRFRGRNGWVTKKTVGPAKARPFMTPAEQMVTAALPAALERSIDAASRAAFGD